MEIPHPSQVCLNDTYKKRKWEENEQLNNLKNIWFKAAYGILLPKLFWPTSEPKKLLKFEAEGREFANILRSLGQFIQTVKG